MSNKDWPKHLYLLDISRGLAAIAVVLWHWQHFSYKGNSLPGTFLWENQPLYELLAMFYEKGQLGVQYFFLLSGFIFFWLYGESIKNKLIGIWEFGVNRFARLYPLHFITLIIIAVLQNYYLYKENTSFVYVNNDIFHFVLNLGFASTWGLENGFSFNGPVWSVSVEILLYSVFFILASFRFIGAFHTIIISFSAYVLYYLTYNPILIGLSMFFLGGLVFYVVNLILHYKKNTVITMAIYVITFFCWSGVLINFYVYDISQLIDGIGLMGRIFLQVFSEYILFPLTVISLVIVEINKGPLLKSFSWIGDITYSSYLLHFPLQLLFAISVSLGILHPSFYLDKTYLILFFLILIPASYLTFIMLEKPLQKRLKLILLGNKKK